MTFVGCANCYTLLFLCPNNLFRQFLVHKILASKYICENGKNKRDKKKRKGFPASWAGVGFWPRRRKHERAGARAPTIASVSDSSRKPTRDLDSLLARVPRRHPKTPNALWTPSDHGMLRTAAGRRRSAGPPGRERGGADGATW